MSIDDAPDADQPYVTVSTTVLEVQRALEQADQQDQEQQG